MAQQAGLNIPNLTDSTGRMDHHLDTQGFQTVDEVLTDRDLAYLHAVDQAAAGD
jgi:hypothetical protein